MGSPDRRCLQILDKRLGENLLPAPGQERAAPEVLTYLSCSCRWRTERWTSTENGGLSWWGTWWTPACHQQTGFAVRGRQKGCKLTRILWKVPFLRPYTVLPESCYHVAPTTKPAAPRSSPPDRTPHLLTLPQMLITVSAQLFQQKLLFGGGVAKDPTSFGFCPISQIFLPIFHETFFPLITLTY